LTHFCYSTDEDKYQGDTVEMPPVAMINPEWWPLDCNNNREGTANETAPVMEVVWESCLSIPGKKVMPTPSGLPWHNMLIHFLCSQVLIKRYSRIGWSARRLDGARIEGEASGRFALTFQHEVDHLNGVCMTEHDDETSNLDVTALKQIRSDNIGPVSSSRHLDIMEEPGYSLRSAMPPGSRVSAGH